MERAKPFLPMIIIIILEVVLGIFLAINPLGFTEVLIKLIGIILLVGAVVGVVHLISNLKNHQPIVGSIIGVALALVFGLICLLGTGWIIGLISLFAWLYGLILIVMGIVKFASFAQVRSAGLNDKTSYLVLISGIIMLIFGVILLFHPFGTIEVLLRIGGIVLIVEAVFDLVTMILNMRGMRAAS